MRFCIIPGKPNFSLWLKVALWCGLIFILSAIPNHKGEGIDFETLYGMFRYFLRKAAHLAEYSVLMIFTYDASLKTLASVCKFCLLASFVFAVAYAASDEFHQTFVFGRLGTVADVFIDSIGAFAGFLYYECALK